MTVVSNASAFGSVQALKKTSKMPVIFLGHGSPMNAIEDNDYRRSWQSLGAKFGAQWPMPQLIFCISAHWLTNGWWLTAMTQPKTIHDFGGFPPELFDQQYPAPGFPQAAQEISQRLHQPGSAKPLSLDFQEWGLDHGAWSVLKPMFPAADVPVIQLSMDYSRPPAEHYALGQQLKGLRERGVLIVGSGNMVHNLRTLQMGVGPNQAYDWALEFDQTIADYLQNGNLAALQNFQALGAVAKESHPTHEHFLPLLYAAGAVDASETPQFFNTSFQAASISMRSVIWA
ncbi:MAG: 4,5-DOPA dioxygenase extradiol [Polaromonas sp.]|nr:4,5-DOPA dioxygenase extradiol [Polaromonas sp.]